jgi:hypothetical protein
MKLLNGMFGLALLTSASLAGCNNNTTVTTAQIIAQIQSATALGCSVEPTAASIATLLASLNPAATATVAIVAQVADQICKVVGTSASANAAKVGSPSVPAPIMINGVQIEFETVGTAK